MVRYFLLAFALLGLVAAPVGLDGTFQDAQAQRRKRGKTVKKKRKRSRKKLRRRVRGKSVRKGRTVKKRAQKRLFVKTAVRNTNKVLGKARLAVKAGAKGKGMLRDAVIRQHAARKARAAKKFRQAFYLTRTARRLARDAIVANGMTVEAETDNWSPKPEDMQGVDDIVKGVETAGKVPAIDAIADDATVGVNLPEDEGDDEGVLAEPDDSPEVEVEVE